MIAVASYWKAFADIGLGILGSLLIIWAVVWVFAAIEDDDTSAGMVLFTMVWLVSAVACFAGVVVIHGVP